MNSRSALRVPWASESANLIGVLTPSTDSFESGARSLSGGLTLGWNWVRFEKSSRGAPRPIRWNDSANFSRIATHGRRLGSFFSRTPGPPPFSSMNSMPAPSSVRRIARSLAAVSAMASSATSARRIVFTPRADSRARSCALHRRRARAALIWALESGPTFIVDCSTHMG
jgi:hypothetical protein